MSGIYIHIPFCKQACHYCDFHFSTSLKMKRALVEALQKELILRKDEGIGEVIETIYFGGGTPSVLEISELQSIIKTVYKHYQVIENPEITLEANPDDLTDESVFKNYKNIGINRLSIGIQSFFDGDLKLMNRAHDANEAKACLQTAKKYFDNISIDLIYGIPGMSVDRWLKNIQTALAFDVPHLSCYALTVEPKTALHSFIKKGIMQAPDDEMAQLHFQVLTETLEKQNFIHYELSNFGKEGFFSKNNTAYWLGKKYLGIGPSAHSYDGLSRSWNVSNNHLYINRLIENRLPSEKEILTQKDRFNEAVMTGLRTIWGVSFDKISADFGRHYLDYLIRQAQPHLQNKLLRIEKDIHSPELGRLITTQKGKFLSDGIASDLFLLNDKPISL
ncbi:MAG: coproporphyrinogen III oxidase [Bacteroidetes bacterium HGW-Bacteroidetes-13]|nr:MAG: coproporphyrinogen III oxidase [Bacteroidetes bacterium HGW-Bacteroidetes-13]